MNHVLGRTLLVLTYVSMNDWFLFAYLLLTDAACCRVSDAAL